MKIFAKTSFLLMAFSLVACTPKDPQKKTTPNDIEPDEPVEHKVELQEKGPPPALPVWAKFPPKSSSEGEVVAAVQTLSLQVGPDRQIKIRPPYKIYQTDVLREEGGNVMMPVRVVRDNFWLLGLLEMYQVEVKVPGGTVLYDGPKGVEVGFVSIPIAAQVKKVENDWAQITHEMNTQCSPVFLKVWVKKSSLMATAGAPVPFPAKYDKSAPKNELRKDAALFDIFSTISKDTSVIQLPMCNVETQVLMTGTSSGKRTQIMFKPTPQGPFAVLGWMDKDTAAGKLFSSCTCGTPPPPPRTPVVVELQYDYKTRLPLPLFLEPNTESTAVGMVEATAVKRVVKSMKNPEFGQLEIEDGLTFFVPYHANYYEP